MLRRINLGLFCLLLVCFTSAQNTVELKNKLKENKQQLALSKRILKETKSQQKATLKTLNIYKNQIRLRNEVLETIENDLEKLSEDIEYAKDEISGITDEISRIKSEFSEAVLVGYKSNKKLSKLHYIFLASSFNDLIRRLNYLDRILDFRKLQLDLIQDKKVENSVKINQLLGKQKELAVRLIEKEKELEQLAVDKEGYSNLVNRLRSKESQLISEIQKRERRSTELQNEIKRAITDEKLSQPKKVIVSENLNGFSPKSLQWPVDNGYISERFGRHKHQDFKNVTTQNNGIDIICEPNTEAKAVYEGTVSAIIQIPGMQTTVLVKHGEYYSVYGNLSEASVEHGQELKTNEKVGTVGRNEDGMTEMHFEVWKGTTKLNPQKWIRQ